MDTEDSYPIILPMSHCFRTLVLSLIWLAAPALGQYGREWQSGNLGYGAWGASYGYDLDGDGLPNFWIRSPGQLVVYGANYAPRWTISLPGYEYPMLVTPRDIDGDGLVRPVQLDGDPAGEIVVTAYKVSPSVAGIVRVYDATSRALEWQSAEIAGFSGSLSLDDVDGDGRHELILTRSDYSGNWGYVEVWGFSGAGCAEEVSFVPKMSIPVTSTTPVEESSRIRFELAAAGQVNIQIHNQSGQIVRTLIAAKLPAGRYDVVWDCRDNSGIPVPAGTYIYRLECDQKVGTGTIQVVRHRQN